jgi:cell division transport system permease protein
MNDAQPETAKEPPSTLASMPAAPTGGGMPLVPPGTIAARSLVTVVAIMTFLAAMTAGAVQLVATAASEWRSSIASEATIQIRPRAGRDIEADIAEAVAIARRTPGIAEARAYSRSESEKLLEPWLGAGLQLGEISVPRMIVLRLGGASRPDLQALRQEIARAIPGASLEDHRLWVERLQAMAGMIVIAGIAVVLMVLVATGLAVGFATQGAMAGNRGIVEILHFVGAEDSFIIREFARHFLRLGLQGGAIGAGATILVIWIAGFIAGRMRASAGGDQLEAMFGSFDVGLTGYLFIVAIAIIVAGVTAYVSSRTVGLQLKRMFISN